MIYFHNVRQQVHKKTNSKTGFTLVCYSFKNIIFFFLGKVKQKFSCIFSTKSATIHFFRCMTAKTGGHMNAKNKLSDMPIQPLLYTMAVTLMLSLLVQSLYNIVDSMNLLIHNRIVLTGSGYTYS